MLLIDILSVLKTFKVREKKLSLYADIGYNCTRFYRLVLYSHTPFSLLSNHVYSSLSHSISLPFIALCGGAFSASDSPQTISSPSYPRPVGQDLRCRWTIDSGDSNQQIRVSFNGLNLISDNNCSVEYIELRDSPLVSILRWVMER